MAMKKLGAGWTKPAKTKQGNYVNVQVTEDIPKGSFIQIWKNERKVDGTNQPDFNVVCYIK